MVGMKTLTKTVCKAIFCRPTLFWVKHCTHCVCYESNKNGMDESVVRVSSGKEAGLKLRTIALFKKEEICTFRKPLKL